FLRQWGTTKRKGHFAGDFIYPTDAALAGNGDLFIADAYANRIQVFDRGGKFLTKWGGPFAIGIPGGFNGWFRVAISLAFGSKGDLFVADFYNDRIQKFSANGIFLTSFGHKGASPGDFHHPIGVAVARDGSVFVADLANDRIEKWRPTQ
ncbi:MAG: 6-bladed beta-propeller, partial [Alphaproteobacteria bacterium]|nr:6-bladed beta-propeller [Alphaproteobacteria bacterium]